MLPTSVWPGWPDLLPGKEGNGLLRVLHHARWQRSKTDISLFSNRPLWALRGRANIDRWIWRRKRGPKAISRSNGYHQREKISDLQGLRREDSAGWPYLGRDDQANCGSQRSRPDILRAHGRSAFATGRSGEIYCLV